MENINFGISNKGARTVIYKQYEYVHHRNTSVGVTHWRCNKYRTLKCKSILHTRENQVIREPVEHNHGAKNYEGEAHKLVNEMKQAMTNPGASTHLTIAIGMAQAPEGVQMALPKKNSLVRRLQYAKSKTQDNAPANPRDIHFLIPEKYNEWVLYDSGIDDPTRIILFGHRTLLQLLVTNECWLADGTFKVVPEIFFQLYSIHVQLDGGIALPCVLALLPNKTQDSYCKMLMAITELIPDAKPTRIITDFEAAAINSFQLIYPDIEVSGCYFHLNQSMIRRVSTLGLKNLYESDPEFATCTKMLCALAIVPEDEVLEGFFDISEIFDTLGYIDNEAVQELLAYFERTYIRGRQLRDGSNQQALFPIASWNHHNAAINCVARTTNAVEGWHYGLQSIFQCSHPSMWKFLDSLILEISLQHGYYIQHCVGQRNPGKRKYRILADRVTNIVTNYNTDERVTFLRAIAHLV